MRDTRLILVEGMPGTGKSTVSQFVHLQLQANGLPSYWCHEESAAHPVRLFYDRARHHTWSDYCDEAASLWQSFARELQRTDQIAVLDGAVLQNHVRSMLLFDCDRNSIFELAHTIENLLSSLHPVWIYLRPKDIEQNFRDVVAARGQLMLDLWLRDQERFPYAQSSQARGFTGFMAFWQEFSEIADRVFDELAISKLKQNISNDNWYARSRELLAFLNLPAPSELVPTLTLERYAGKYVSLQNHTAPECMLQEREGCLIATVDKPTIDTRHGPIGCFREVRLIPKGENRFYVEAWPHLIEFTEDESNTIVSMRLSISDTGWERSDIVYIRQ